MDTLDSSAQLTMATSPALVVSSCGDYEAPAGGDEARPRIAPPALAYIGEGEEHWHEQPCYLVEHPAASAACALVVFACGCRALVARGSVVPLA